MSMRFNAVKESSKVRNQTKKMDRKMYVQDAGRLFYCAKFVALLQFWCLFCIFSFLSATNLAAISS